MLFVLDNYDVHDNLVQSWALGSVGPTADRLPHDAAERRDERAHASPPCALAGAQTPAQAGYLVPLVAPLTAKCDPGVFLGISDCEAFG